MAISRLQHLTAAHWKQAIKTGIAGALAWFLAELLLLPQPYWAAVSAVIVMQSEYAATFKGRPDAHGRHRDRRSGGGSVRGKSRQATSPHSDCR